MRSRIRAISPGPSLILSRLWDLRAVVTQAGPEPAASGADCVAKIETSAQSLLGILNDILDFSKIEAGKLRRERMPFDLRLLVERASQLVAIAAAVAVRGLPRAVPPPGPATRLIPSGEARR